MQPKVETMLLIPTISTHLKILSRYDHILKEDISSLFPDIGKYVDTVGLKAMYKDVLNHIHRYNVERRIQVISMCALLQRPNQLRSLVVGDILPTYFAGLMYVLSILRGQTSRKWFEMINDRPYIRQVMSDYGYAYRKGTPDAINLYLNKVDQENLKLMQDLSYGYSARDITQLDDMIESEKPFALLRMRNILQGNIDKQKSLVYDMSREIKKREAELKANKEQEEYINKVAPLLADIQKSRNERSERKQRTADVSMYQDLMSKSDAYVEMRKKTKKSLKAAQPLVLAQPLVQSEHEIVNISSSSSIQSEENEEVSNLPSQPLVGSNVQTGTQPSVYKMARGKGIGKGLGKGKVGRKRKRKSVDVIGGITKPSIRRLARRGGVKRISGDIYEETRNRLKAFLKDVVEKAVIYCEHAKRKTVTVLDVIYALKQKGLPLYY